MTGSIPVVASMTITKIFLNLTETEQVLLIENLQKQRDLSLVTYRKKKRKKGSKKPKKKKEAPAEFSPELKKIFGTMSEAEKRLFV